MRIILFLLLLLPVILFKAGSQQPADGPPDVEVGEISSSRFRTYEPNEGTGGQRVNSNKADTRSRETVYRDDIQNRNSIENRSRDMLDLEKSVMGESGSQRPIDLFRYRVNLRNTGVKLVKAIVWDYQASDTDQFTDSTHRQFRCTAKIKPNQSERVEGFSVLPPTRVITASGAKSFSERVIINRIDYADGTSWQRSDWRQPDGNSKYKSRGNCQQL